MQVVELLPEGKALVRQDTLEAVVDLALIPTDGVGDFVIIHAGYAIEVLEPSDAEETLKLFKEMKPESGSEG